MTPKVLNYVYGLAGRDVTVESLGEVFEAMQEVDKSGNIGDAYRYLSLRG
jgi:pyruvate ferredoxin oxidoreductase alpha subunit